MPSRTLNSGVQAAGQNCVLITDAEEDGQFSVSVCDAIGTPVKQTTTEVAPGCLAMTSTHVVIATGTTVFVWPYTSVQGTSCWSKSEAAAMQHLRYCSCYL